MLCYVMLCYATFSPPPPMCAGGMPDLLLWRNAPGAPPAARLAEVKGPRDRLSDQQRAWIAALSRAGLEVEVLKVVEPAARAKRLLGAV
jgi:Fanconi-associated nuclease 1